jgi:hypothetical protein
MKSTIVKRAIVIGGHKTTISLDDAFWRGLKEIAHARCVTLSKVVIDTGSRIAANRRIGQEVHKASKDGERNDKVAHAVAGPAVITAIQSRQPSRSSWLASQIKVSGWLTRPPPVRRPA